MDTGVIVWNLVTSFFVALVMFMIKMNHDEQKRLEDMRAARERMYTPVKSTKVKA